MKQGELKQLFFIAVFLPDHIQEQIAQQVERARNSNATPDSWKWKRSSNYHISLAFPGRLNTGELRKLKEALSQVDIEAFDIKIRGTNWFERTQNKAGTNTHVVWAQPTEHSANSLKALQSQIQDALKRRGFGYGRTEFLPHITLVKTPIDDAGLAQDFMRSHDDLKTDSWRCDSFGIYKTLNEGDPEHPDNNDGEGSRFQKVSEFHLRR